MAARRNRGEAGLYNRPKRRDDKVAKPSQIDAPPLAAGEIVSTSTLTDARPVAPGKTWSTAFEGLPLNGLEASFR